MMTAPVYWGSPRQAQLDARETLPAKLNLVLDRLNLRERVQGRRVAIKLHLGVNVGYSMVHPVFVRQVVQAVLEGGGKPFVTDLPHSVASAHTRGYTAETLGCPLYPSTGIDEQWTVTKPYSYRNMTEFHMGGAIEAADFLIDFAHVKGHPATGWGAAIKNLALGCMAGPTRGAMHDVSNYTPAFFKAHCPDEATRVAIRESCPHGAIVDDKEDPNGLHLHYGECNQCMRCQDIAPGALVIDRSNFMAFLEVVNIAAKLVLDTFEPGNAIFLNLATHMTPVCDCFGFTGMPVLPDAGIFGSDDIVAVEQATLDKLAESAIVAENLPGSMEIVRREGHPWTWIHGPYKDPIAGLAHAEELGIGSRAYTLEDVLPVVTPQRAEATYIQAAPN
jgi:uncharacterized Fe-S center protein